MPALKQTTVESEGPAVKTLPRMPELVIPMPPRGTTHFDFAGDIRVEGDVPAGVRIRAGGNVRVDGDLLGGHIRADGSVEVNGTVRLHSWIEAANDITVRSGQRSVLRCEGNLRVSGDLAYCETEVGGAAWVGGRVFGGHLVSDLGVHAMALGTRSAPRTQVMIVPTWRRKARLAEVETSLRREEARLSVLRNAAEIARTPREASFMHMALTEVERLYRTLILERDMLARATRLAGLPAVSVEQGVFPGVDLQVEEATLAVRSLLPPGRFYVRHGRIVATREAS